MSMDQKDNSPNTRRGGFTWRTRFMDFGWGIAFGVVGTLGVQWFL